MIPRRSQTQTMTGSPKQIEWADAIKAGMRQYQADAIANAHPTTSDDDRARWNKCWGEFWSFVERIEPSAQWWIHHFKNYGRKGAAPTPRAIRQFSGHVDAPWFYPVYCAGADLENNPDSINTFEPVREL